MEAYCVQELKKEKKQTKTIKCLHIACVASPNCPEDSTV